jgi:hypothetical protein
MENDERARLTKYKQEKKAAVEKEQQEQIKRIIESRSLLKFGTNGWRDSASFADYCRLNNFWRSDEKPDYVLAEVETKSRLYGGSKAESSLEFEYFLLNTELRSAQRVYRLTYSAQDLPFESPGIRTKELHEDIHGNPIKIYLEIDDGDSTIPVHCDINL